MEELMAATLLVAIGIATILMVVTYPMVMALAH